MQYHSTIFHEILKKKKKKEQPARQEEKSDSGIIHAYYKERSICILSWISYGVYSKTKKNVLF
jgi:hypothetical protein